MKLEESPPPSAQKQSELSRNMEDTEALAQPLQQPPRQPQHQHQPQPQPQPPPPPTQPPTQPQQYLFRQFQQQQQAAMARFPSNIDAHLRPLGANRPLTVSPFPIPISNPNPNPNLNSNPLHPPNPNSTSQPHLQPKVIRTPSQPHPPPPAVDARRPRPDLKRPFDASERDKVSNDAFFTVRDRKVRISDEGAIYALCRSWLRNGYPEESQPQYADVSKSLPKPLPVSKPSSPETDDDDESDSEDENCVETSCARDLLQRHIERAKRVRKRLRKERSQRIKRYKSRLSYLLHLPTEPCRSDTVPSA